MTVRRLRSLVFFACLLLVDPHPPLAQERSTIPEKYTWDLTDLFPDDAAWKDSHDALKKEIPELGRFQGRLGESAAVLLDALSARMETARKLDLVTNYASQKKDQDSRVGESQEMDQGARNLRVDFTTAVSWMRPEIVSLGEDKMRGYIAAEPRLKPYEPYLRDILRWAPHTLTPPEEKIVARAGNLVDTGESVYTMLTTAELPFPVIRLPGGDSLRLSDAAYSEYRSSPDRDVRRLVFREFWGAYDRFKRTMATTLYGQIQSHVFTRDVRKFDSCLEQALFGDNIPISVYRRLIADVHDNLPTLHRYLELRRRMMGLDSLGYEDLYAPIVATVDLKFTPEEAMELTLKSLEPLGREYVDSLRKGFDSRWIDWLPNTGKSSGAYSTIAYGTHPYQLQNFAGKYEDVATLAHEAGHSMHSLLSDRAQPYVTHDYATFVAEVASTLNENLLLHHTLDNAKDDDTRLFLLGSYLEGLRTTLFRQTLFAEFELGIHEMCEKGESLTGDNLGELYLGLLRTYYGHDRRICRIDDLYGVEWAFIAHFYYNFYVFQYATSLVASTSIANAIRAGALATTARDAYLRMLSAGSSKYPVDLLKDAGVDMTTSGPFQAAMKEMNRVMDDMEAILARRGR